MGTPEFAVSALKALAAGGYPVEAAVTQPDRPKGRGRHPSPPPVKAVALQLQVPVFQPQESSDPRFLDVVRDMAPDLIVVVAYGQVLKGPLLRIPRWGAVNVHASLLPKYRGAAPVQRAILDNQAKTGLTAMVMEEGLDCGPILLQEETSILPDEPMGLLHDRLAAMAGPFLVRTLKGLAEGRLRATPQDPGAATYAKKIDPRMRLVDWREPAERISALIRALDPRPGAYTTLRGQTLKLFSGSALPEDSRRTVPGRIVRVGQGELRVEAGQGLVRIRSLQAPGRKRLPLEEFLRGFPLAAGELLGGGE